MSARPIRLRLHGEDIVLAVVPRHVDVGAQVQWILQHCDPVVLRDAFAPSRFADTRAVTNQLATELEFGGVTLLRIPKRDRTLDAPEVSNLSDLIVDEPVAPGLAPGTVPGTVPGTADLAGDRELIFAVVSAEGLLLRAQWSVEDTADEHAGDLIQEARVQQKVHAKALRVQLENLELEAAPAVEAEA